MSTKYTPGPWEVQGGWIVPEGSGVHEHGSHTGPYVAHVPFGIAGEGEANARLIAAAPDLLAACKRFLDTIGSPVETNAVTFTVSISDMRAAIAKAEGATPTNQGEPAC